MIYLLRTKFRAGRGGEASSDGASLRLLAVVVNRYADAILEWDGWLGV